jgi:hypothetical protein
LDAPVALTFPSPTVPLADRREVLLGYLDYFRSVVHDKVAGLPESDLRGSRLPSGWSPLELVRHLTAVERRWLEWGFLGRDVGDPWWDRRDDRWYVGADEPVAAVLAAFDEQAVRTRAIVLGASLDDIGRPSERWDGADPPTLERVLLHLVQEFARHCGHLDVVRELVDGTTGEGG